MEVLRLSGIYGTIHEKEVEKEQGMAIVKLEQIIGKMKLENLTPELDISKIKITQPDINRPALQMARVFRAFRGHQTADYRICGVHLYAGAAGGKKEGNLYEISFL